MTYGIITVSYPRNWTEQGDTDLIELRAPNGGLITYGGPTAGTWDATSCDQYGRAQGGEPAGQEPIKVSGISTTEYSYLDGHGAMGYEVSVYFPENGACESIVASPMGSALDRATVEGIFGSTRYHF